MTTSENHPTIQLTIEGAGCASCVGKIEKALRQVPNVITAEMNFADRSVQITGKAKVTELIRAVTAIGYQAKELNIDNSQQLLSEQEQADSHKYRQLLFNTLVALSLGIPLMVYGLLGGAMTVSTDSERLAWLCVGMLTLAIMYFAGKHFYLGAWQSFKNHNANMDTLIALGTGAAWLYSLVVIIVPTLVPEVARHIYLEATVMIIGLVNLGLALEIRARGKTSQAIKHLIGLQPKTATVIKDMQELTIDIANVQTNDIVMVRPGEKIPVDGVVREGKSHIDESMLTGEPIPTSVSSGSQIAAGTINQSGVITFVATHVGQHTALARIIQMVKQAQNAKLPIGRLADKISAYFVPAVMILAILSGLIWLNFGTGSTVALAMVSMTTVLIIACPCALGLATPMSVMVGVGKAAEQGILIRNGEALQTASKLTTIVLDKTGTITQGAPVVTDIQTANGFSTQQVLQLAASIENNSEHPLARAIIISAKHKQLNLQPTTDFSAIAGFGVKAIINGQQILLGNDRLMRRHDINIDAQQTATNAFASETKTPVYIAVDNQLAGIIAITDPIKPDSAKAIKLLQQHGINIIMITGDNELTAKAVAEQVGIKEFIAQVLPAEKAEKIKELQAKGAIVAMTGDGINDAPALAQANVGFAIGTGTDVAIESADVTLMRGSLLGLVDAIAISRATLINIKQNLTGAFIYNVAGIPIAAGLLYPFFGFMLSPVIAGAAMAFSSLTVVSNANRLRFFKPKHAIKE